MKSLFPTVVTLWFSAICLLGCQATSHSTLSLKERSVTQVQESRSLSEVEAGSLCLDDAKRCVQATMVRTEAVELCKLGNTPGGKFLKVAGRTLSYLFNQAKITSDNVNLNQLQPSPNLFRPLTEKCHNMIRSSCKERYRICVRKLSRNSSSKMWLPQRDSERMMSSYRR